MDISACRTCHHLAAPVNPSIHPGAPLVVMPFPSVLDSRTGRLLSGRTGEGILQAIRVNLGVPNLSVIARRACPGAFLPNVSASIAQSNCLCLTDLQILYARPIAILCLGYTAGEQIIKRNIVKGKEKIEKYGDCIKTPEIPVVITAEVKDWEKSSKMLQILDDLTLLRRACDMRLIELAHNIFPVCHFSALGRLVNLRQLWNERKFDTDKYREVVQS